MQFMKWNRDDTIRTCDPCFPKAVLYQTELHPVEEDQGFEPWKVLPLLVFKTNAINHSANLPYFQTPNTIKRP